MPGLRQIPAHRTTPRLSIRKCSANRFALALSMQSQHKLLRSHVDPAGIHLEHPNLLRLRCPLRLPDPVTVSCRPCKFRLKRPRILFGIGEEGGGPIYVQAHGLRGGRPPRRSWLVCLMLKIQGAGLGPPASDDFTITSRLHTPPHATPTRVALGSVIGRPRVAFTVRDFPADSAHPAGAGGASPSPTARGARSGDLAA